MKDSSAQVKNKKLKDIRIESKLTQDDVATALEMTRSAYQHLEAKGNLSGEILFKLSRIFSRPMEDFLDNVDIAMRLKEEPISFNKNNDGLTDEEAELLDAFASLSAAGKARVIGYVKGISWSEKSDS